MGRRSGGGILRYGFVAVGSLGFVHFYFGTGKGWLLGAALGLRLLAVVANFSTGLNLHISAIQSLQQVNFLGEPVSMLGEWTSNPWVRLGQFAALVQFVYVVDASLRLWRTGARESRRRALIVGGPLAFFILFSSAQAGLVAAGVLRTPIVVSFPFLAVLLAMGYELSRDALRAAQLGRELQESEIADGPGHRGGKSRRLGSRSGAEQNLGEQPMAGAVRLLANGAVGPRNVSATAPSRRP